MKEPRLFTRGHGWWYYRQQVPADLRKAVGKREILISLKTTDRTVAEREAARAKIAADEQLDRARRKLKPATVTPALIAHQWFTTEVRERFGIESRDDPSPAVDTPEERRASIDAWLAAEDATLPPDRLQAVYAAAEARFGRDYQPEIWAAQDTLDYWGHGQPDEPEMSTLSLPRLTGRRMAPPISTASAGDGLLFSQMFDAYCASNPRGPTTTADRIKTRRRFVECFGDLPARDVTTDHMDEFGRMLARMPVLKGGDRSPHVGKTMPTILKEFADQPDVKRLDEKSVKQHFVYLSAAFTYGIKKKHVDASPTKDMDKDNKLSGKGGDSGSDRLPYTDSDLKLIFAGEPFTSAPKDPAKRNARFWLPIIGLFSGARRGELAQLRVSDVGEEEGFPYLDINDRDGKKLKNKASIRKFPVHKDVIALGFLKYVEALRARGEKQLFPELDQSRPGNDFGKWWTRYTVDLNIPDRQDKVFHSFRHTLKDACRRAEIPKGIFDRIQGHSTSDIGDEYGLGYPMRLLAKNLNKVKYPGLKIGA